jgi:acetoin utilization deacetylase AcuC-like enzyme
MPLALVYSPRYGIDIGPHVFPTEKYRRVWEGVLEGHHGNAVDLLEPEPVPWDDLELVHTSEYLDKLRLGSLSEREVAQLEIPWSTEIVEGFRLMTGGTVTAARASAKGALSVHLGGGFHHAFANHGEGFCMFNDVAVATRVLQRSGLARRAAIVDCDVHHGNGTAMIFDGDSTVFTFSIHQQHNYPMFKPASDLDIGLGDGTGDREYLRRLEGALPQILSSGPDVVFYLAGADPFREDQLGGLALSRDGLRDRDRLVIRAVRSAGAALVITLAGGYARRLEDTVAIHTATVEEAMRAMVSYQ